MSYTTIELLAKEIGEPVNQLIEHFASAGVLKRPKDSISDKEKSILLKFLHNSYGKLNSSSINPSFEKKKRSTMSISYGGKNKSVSVEVRKKKTFSIKSNANTNNSVVPDANNESSEELCLEKQSVSIAAVKKEPAKVASADNLEKNNKEECIKINFDTNEKKLKKDSESLKSESCDASLSSKESLKINKNQESMKSLNHENKSKQINSLSVSKENNFNKNKDKEKQVSIKNSNKKTQSSLFKRDKLFSSNISSSIVETSSSKLIAEAKVPNKKPSSFKKQGLDILAHKNKEKKPENNFDENKIIGIDKEWSYEADKNLLDDSSDSDMYSSSDVVAAAQKAAEIKDENSSPNKSRKKSSSKAKYSYSSNSLAKKNKSKSNFSAQKSFASKNKHGFNKPQSKVVKEVELQKNSTIILKNLAIKMSIKNSLLIKALSEMGIAAKTDYELDYDTAQIVIEDLGFKFVEIDNDLEGKYLVSSKEGGLVSRSPVVTIMGHVDHGKTSLLDRLRSSRITENESGGITQSIGAYQVVTEKGSITFLDTPGHAAFTDMRSRGANVTDIVVLVVAADDGVKPQTIEAINHSKAAGTTIMVAINKIDKPEIDLERIKSDLSSHGILSEDWGGEHLFSHISAKTGEGIDEFLDSLLLQAELLELSASDSERAKGVIIESYLNKGKGLVSHALIRSGKLKVGDFILSGSQYGKVKALRDDRGRIISEAGPSMPVEILGFSEITSVGDDINVVQSEKIAKTIAQKRILDKTKNSAVESKGVSLEDLFSNISKDERVTLNIVLKADSQGTLEAVSNSLLKLDNDEVSVKLVSCGVGPFAATDASLAATSKAIMVGFNVRADYQAKSYITKNSIDARYYSVIYDLIDEVNLSLKGLLKPEYVQKIIGLSEVRDVFKTPKGLVAGCMVSEGIMKRNCPVRVLRDNVVIYEGELNSLRRFKEDSDEVKSGFECGISIKNYLDVRVGDKIEAFALSEIKR